MSDFNDQIIAEFRSNGGTVTTNGFGRSLVLVHTVGARTKASRVSPLMAIPQPQGGWLIAASKAGAPDNPAWFANLVAHPETVIEVGDGEAVTTVEVTASVLEGAERDAAWAQFTATSPGFADYQVRAGGRVIPVVLLSPRDTGR